MTRVYYKYAIAAIIGIIYTPVIDLPFSAYQQPIPLPVFDLSRPATFEAVAKV